MKYGRLIVMVFAMLAGSSLLNANELVDFDARNPGAAALNELLADNAKADEAAIIPVRVQTEKYVIKMVTLKVSMATGTSKKIETLQCQIAADGKKLEKCIKQSNAAGTTNDDINAMLLYRYFPGQDEASFESLLETSRHSYCNSSGPQEFCCEDTCANYELEEVEVGTGGANGTWVCKEWTHDCNCTKNCY